MQKKARRCVLAFAAFIIAMIIGMIVGLASTCESAYADLTIQSIPDQYWTGSSIKPNIVVKDGSQTVNKKLYRVKYSSNKDIGTATVTVKGKKVRGLGDYKGEEDEATFRIVPVNLSQVKVERIKKQSYKGKEITPKPKVKIGSKTLNKKYYDVEYENNIDPTTSTKPAKIILTGDGEYCTGTKTITFQIVEDKLVSGELTAAKIPDQIWTGSSIKPKFNITCKSTASGKVYSLGKSDCTISYKYNRNVGKALVRVKGKKRFRGRTLETSFEIVPADISKASVLTKKQPYTGEPVSPKFQVTLNRTKLNKNHYDIKSIKNNVEPGIATVTLEGIQPNCTGTRTFSFTIYEKDLVAGDFKIDPIDEQLWLGNSCTPKFTVRCNGKVVDPSEYKVKWADNSKPTTSDVKAKVQVQGTSKRFKGKTATASFKISKLDLSNTSNKSLVIDAIPNQTYTGSALTPKPRITVGGKTLSSKCYTLSYSNNTHVTSEATVKITGQGEYCVGSRVLNFKIVANSNKFDGKLEIADLPDKEWNWGNAVTQSLTVNAKKNSGESEKISSSNYSVSYANNINVGTATVTVTGKNKYSGLTAKKTFKITKKDISKASVSVVDQTRTTGGAITPPAEDITVRLGGRSLSASSDYTFSASNNTANTTTSAKLTITGKGNFTGSVTKDFSIEVAANITLELNAADNIFSFTGKAIEPSLKRVKEDGSLREFPSNQYTVSYGNNINVTQYKDERPWLKVKLLDPYSGSKMLRFLIAGTATGTGSSSNIVISAPANIKTSKKVADLQKAPKSVTLNYNGKSSTLTAGTDYTVSYKTSAGKALSANSNYTGKVIATVHLKPFQSTETDNGRSRYKCPLVGTNTYTYTITK